MKHQATTSIAKDRAGQHHALVMALTMFDRARWTGKTVEADIFRQWLQEQLNEADTESDQIWNSLSAEPRLDEEQLTA